MMSVAVRLKEQLAEYLRLVIFHYKLRAHLFNKHDVNAVPEDRLNKIVQYLDKYDANTTRNLSVPTQHEFNRDLLVWFARDLLAFSSVRKDGMSDFFKKYLPSYSLPNETTLSKSALDDMFIAAVSKVKQFLSDIRAICVMFDGWTDKYRARSYLAIRISVVKEWKVHIVTLNCDVLAAHSSDDMTHRVSMVLKQFFPDITKLFLTTCHDGASNCMKTSRLLKSQHAQHCISHVLHLLLTTDSLLQVPGLQNLLLKCRKVITTLHFKGAVIDDQLTISGDREMLERIENVIEQLDLDDQFPVEVGIDEVEGDMSDVAASITASQYRGSHTLKQYVTTRWNSSLTMIRSILDLEFPIQAALRKTGQMELCFFDSELSLLKELKAFLEPFEVLTSIASSSNVLSFVPLIKPKIQKICIISNSDDTMIKLVKKKILKTLDKRFPESDFVRICQVLDPETRLSVPQDEALRLLKTAMMTLAAVGLFESAGAPLSPNTGICCILYIL